MNIKELSPAERQELMAQLQQQEIEERKKKDSDITVYKELVDESVKKVFPILVGISEKLRKNKAEIRDMFKKAIALKQDIYGMKESQRSHQFMDNEGQFRISIGVYTIDNYDDTVDVGIQKVKDFISTLARDKETGILVDTIMKLLAKDQKGTLKASRVLQLQNMAEQCNNQDFLDGVKIIRDAYRPIESKSYIRAEYKDETGAWTNVPLGLTEA